jgi:PAS domain S-box-containing protein
MTSTSESLPGSDVFRRIADALPQNVWKLLPDGRIAWVNRRFIDVTGRDVSLESTVDDQHLGEFIHPDDLALADAWRDAFLRGEPYEYEFRLKTRDGTYRWYLANATPFRNASGEIEAWYGVGTDIDERRRQADLMAFLAEMGDVLNAARGVDYALTRAAHLAVPRIADWCAVYVRQPDGFFRPAVIHHSDPALVDLANDLVRTYPFSVETQRRLIASRASIFLPAISEESIRSGAVDSRHADWLLTLDLASAIVAPLIVNDEVTGMLHLVRGHRSPPFVRADVDFADAFSSRIAMALDNAIVYERQRDIAATFQSAALPPVLPEIDGVTLGRAYRSGDDALTVGGDWYDAVRLNDGSLLFSIGDVAGSGIHAAVLMASMRQAIRVAGLQGLEPGQILAAANAALVAENGERFVTAFVGRLSPGGDQLAYASAGHPAPLVRESGRLQALATGDPPLGVWTGTFKTRTRTLATPWLLVAFTDGLIERTRNILEGEALLEQIVGDDGIMHAFDPAAYLQARLLGGTIRDDTAIFTIRVDGEQHWRFGADDALRAQPTRRSLRTWLSERTTGDTEAAELIYGELIGNVVRHSPGPIDVDVSIGDRVRLIVQSAGTPIALDPRLPESPLCENGRGLYLVDRLGAGLSCASLPIFGNAVAVDLPVRPR